jgi:hypothetical protein
MAKLINLENLKFGYSIEQYEHIYDMYKKAKQLNDIATELEIPYSRVASVISQINAHLISRRKIIGKIYENPVLEEYSSYKDLLLEVDEEPSVGSVVVVDGRIIHKDSDITNNYRTLKHYF